MIANFSVEADTIKALLLIAAKGDVRFYLNGIAVDSTGTHPVLVATDGHRLLAVRVSDGELIQRGETVIIPRALLDGIKAPKTGSNAGRRLVFDIRGADITITGAVTVTGKAEDGAYPDWRRIVPRETSGHVAGFNPEYLFEFGKARKLLGVSGGYMACPIAHNGEAAALIDCGEDAIGVCMPMRDAVPAGTIAPHAVAFIG